MRLSVVVPAYNEEGYLEECLRCIDQELLACRDMGPFEIIVVDNASTDRTAQIASGLAGVRVVKEPRKGLTRARQCGLEAARGAILAYVDADTRMPAGWIAGVLDAFDASDRVVCVSGPYVYYDLPAAKKALVSGYWHLVARPMYRLTRCMAVGGNFAASRAALVSIGGFDTTIAFYGEDTNVARRLRQVGEVVFDLDLVMPTSARRLHGEGFYRTAMRYAMNFLAEMAFKRPWTTRYRDIC